MNKVRPAGITADRNERVVTIRWEDGKECHYPFAGLRAICPCVECRGGHANMGGPPDLQLLHEAQDENLNLERIETVGSYALQFYWSDGHYTGIYTWDYLRRACS